MTTYAELLQAASGHVRAGHELLRRDGFTTPAGAERALFDFHGALDAIATHGRRLLSPAHSRRMRLDPRAKNLSPAEQATAGLIAGIERIVGREAPHAALVIPGESPWAAAATALRAATDLIALQFDPVGRARTPEARAAMTSNAFDLAHRELALLTRAVVADEELLALRALQRCVPKSIVTRLLPGLAALDGIAQRAVARFGEPAGELVRLELGPTWERVRVGDPVIELGDRLRHLRHVTWAAAEQGRGDGAVIALRDVAVIGIAVHAHTAAFHGGHPMTAAVSSDHRSVGVSALAGRGRAWQSLHRNLSALAALTPPAPTVRDDLVAVSRLLPELAPLDDSISRARLTDPTSRRIAAALNDAVLTMTQIGEDNANTFAALDRSTTLLCLSGRLNRDLLSDRPELAEARLRGKLTPAPQELLDAITVGYDAVRHHPVHPITRTHVAAIAATEVEEAFHVIERA